MMTTDGTSDKQSVETVNNTINEANKINNVENLHAENPDIDVDNHDGLTFEVVEKEVSQGQSVISRGVYLPANIITTMSLLSGFYSVLLSTDGEYYKACLAIFLSAILDGMDGRVARLLNAQSPFGEQFDSLTDMLAFGVAPAVLVYSFALESLNRAGIAAAFVFTACAAFRLARFNVQIGIVDKRYFVGIPSPLAALLVTSYVLVAIKHPEAITQMFGTTQAFAIFTAAWMIICGLSMVSNIKYHSFKEFDRKRVPFAVLVAAVLLLAAMTYDIPVAMLAVGVIYALSGIVFRIKA